MSHTPGPWSIKENAYLNQMIDVEPSIGCVYGVGEEVQANARLIASAPDLLAALQGALFVLEICLEPLRYAEHDSLWAAEDYQDIDLRDEAARWLPAVRAALAKAKGEQ